MYAQQRCAVVSGSAQLQWGSTKQLHVRARETAAQESRGNDEQHDSNNSSLFYGIEDR